MITNLQGTIRQKDGKEIPGIGFSTEQLPESQIEESVKEALRVGFRYIKAGDHGLRREATDRGIREAIREYGIRPDEIYVSSCAGKEMPEKTDMQEREADIPEDLSCIFISEPDLSLLAEIGKKYGKTPVQVYIRCILQEGYIPLVHSVRKEKIMEYSQVFDFILSKEELNAMQPRT